MAEIRIPDKVRRNAEAAGEGARAWLRALPEQIKAIEKRWNIRVSATSERASEAFVAFARTAAGEDVVVKIVMPGCDATRQEIRLLRAADGVGYARLLRADEEQNILLLERLGRQLAMLGLAEALQMEAICATLALAWQARPAGTAFVTGAEKAAELASTIRENRHALRGPRGDATCRHALLAAQRRSDAHHVATSVFVHGDAHAWNTLETKSSASGFKFVDPDGAFAEPAFDLAIAMREWGDVMPQGDLAALAQERCRQLARFAGVREAAIWDWSLLQLVANGLLLQNIGLTASAEVSLAMADAIVASGVFD